MDEILEISAPAQYKALGHPLRHRIVFALGQQAATISQLAKALGQRKGNIAYHLGVLQAAHLVDIVETRQVRGGTEHYYLRVTPTGPSQLLNISTCRRVGQPRAQISDLFLLRA